MDDHERPFWGKGINRRGAEAQSFFSQRLNADQTPTGGGKKNYQGNERQGTNKAVTGGKTGWGCCVVPKITTFYRWVFQILTASYPVNRCKSLMSRVWVMEGRVCERD
jgi:hypothetical protein